MTDNYKRLKEVLSLAVDQAENGKGKERHANGLPFDRQQIVSISKELGSLDFNLGQAVKKCFEISKIKEPLHQVNELLGAINYLAAAIIILQDKANEPKESLDHEISKYILDKLNSEPWGEL